MATNLIIGGQIYIPGEALSLRQMQAIQLSIALDTKIYDGAAAGTLEAQAYAQYVAQGGQQFIANAIATGTLPRISSGDIVGNSAMARDESANPSLPPLPSQILTPAGRLEPAGNNNNGAGTNAVPTPTQQSNPTVGTDATVKPISQTQAVNNQSGQLVPVPAAATATTAPAATQASVRAIDNAIAATGGPGAGAGADTGTGAARINSPFPKYQARNQSYVYQAISVVSSFKQGRFEQTLHGQLFTQSTANTTETNIQQRVDPTTIEGYGVNERGRTKTQQARPASTSTQASVRAVDNSIIASTKAAVVETFSNVDALGNFTGNYN